LLTAAYINCYLKFTKLKHIFTSLHPPYIISSCCDHIHFKTRSQICDRRQSLFLFILHNQDYQYKQKVQYRLFDGVLQKFFQVNLLGGAAL